MVTTPRRPWPKLGGATATMAASASRTVLAALRSRTVARTGPSQVSSIQPSLLAKVLGGRLIADRETPWAPSTTRRPRLSVDRSARCQLLPSKPLASTEADALGPASLRERGSSTNASRFLTLALRRLAYLANGPRSKASSNRYQAAFRLATWTRQMMAASALVISFTTEPSAP